MQQYATVSKLETDKKKLAQINHNLGTLLYMAQQYAQGVKAYKEALRCNPYDDETRYNLAKAMHMLKQQEQQQNQQENQEQNQQQNQQQNDQNKDNQQDDQDQNQDQQQNEKPQNQQNQPQQQEAQITPQAAQQMLQAIQAKEKETQDKVNQKKAAALKSRQKDKNW